jgi:hypothetical protein
MPIRPENKARYPVNWPEISKSIRERAGDKCEKCGVANGAEIMRFTSEDYHGLPVFCLKATGEVFSAADGAFVGYEPPPAMKRFTGGRWVKVVLTVAHLDHTPENCAPENLRCWCQRCHNAYDAPMRRAGTASRARSKAAVGDLFGGTPA